MNSINVTGVTFRQASLRRMPALITFKQAFATNIEMAADKASVIISRSRSESLAFDRATVRRIDQDGRLHVEVTNISKANVCPYAGDEIPNWRELGLAPDRIYRLLRDPNELEKAAPTFNNLPLLSKHVPVSANDHQPDIIVGSTGTDTEFFAPYLRNSLVVWTADAIRGIESGEQRELSCAYRYTPVMESGYHEGVYYDGRMTNIVGNHVAIVSTGRAGPDVIVWDSKLEGKNVMKSKPLSRHAVLVKGALLGSVKPVLAADSAIDINKLLVDVTAKNWFEKKPEILAIIKPKLASDASIDDVSKLLDCLDEDAKDDVIAALDEDPDNQDDDDDDDDEVKAKKKETKEDSVKKEDKKSVPAMDSAAVAKIVDAAVLQAQTQARIQARGAAEAREVVRPYVGNVAVALDSGEDVFKAALDLLGVKTEGIHPSAYGAILNAQPLPGQERRKLVAQDSAPHADLLARFPGL